MFIKRVITKISLQMITPLLPPLLPKLRTESHYTTILPSFAHVGNFTGRN